MKQLDILRLILAGLASAAIIYIIEAITNTAVLGKDWEAWKTVVGTVVTFPSETASLIHWALQALVAGVAGTFIYAGIRTWVGTNLRAAWISGVIIWAVGWLGMSFDKMAMGVEPAKMVHYNVLAALLACLLGQIAASYIYKDKSE